MKAVLRQLAPAGLLAALSMIPGAGAAEAQPFEFALLGDSPYTDPNIGRFRALIDDVNATPGLQWAIHVGDVKSGSSECTDELLRGRFELFRGFRTPFVITPGDNDWFDCVRTDSNAGVEYERLEFFRRLFYSTEASPRAALPSFRSQSEGEDFAEYVENVRWQKSEVVFATLHLVGLTRPPTDAAVAERRMDAALAWIDDAFAAARESGSVGVFLATQVDPWPLTGNMRLLVRLCPICKSGVRGMERLYPKLVEQAAGFEGQVVFAVGDTHVYRVDKPLQGADGALLENFTRVETFGHPDVHWVKVRVEPESERVFSFEQRLVE